MCQRDAIGTSQMSEQAPILIWLCQHLPASQEGDDVARRDLIRGQPMAVELDGVANLVVGCRRLPMGWLALDDGGGVALDRPVQNRWPAWRFRRRPHWARTVRAKPGAAAPSPAVSSGALSCGSARLLRPSKPEIAAGVTGQDQGGDGLGVKGARLSGGDGGAGDYPAASSSSSMVTRVVFVL